MKSNTKLDKKLLENEFILAGKFDKKKFKKFKKIFDEFNNTYNKKPRIKVSSAKAKGRSLQQRVRDIFRNIFKETLEDGDIESRQMGGSGTDIILSPLAKKYIPFDIECKNQESLNIYSVIGQAKLNTKDGRTPLIVFKKNGLEMWCAIPFDEFIKMKYNYDIDMSNYDPNNKITLPIIKNEIGPEVSIKDITETQSLKDKLTDKWIESNKLDGLTLNNDEKLDKLLKVDVNQIIKNTPDDVKQQAIDFMSSLVNKLSKIDIKKLPKTGSLSDLDKYTK